jgi:hypothetical protein
MAKGLNAFHARRSSGYLDDMAWVASWLHNQECSTGLNIKSKKRFIAALTNGVYRYLRRSSGYLDDMAWAATWLHKATGDDGYLQKAEGLFDDCCGKTGTNGSAYGWNDVGAWPRKGWGGQGSVSCVIN